MRVALNGYFWDQPRTGSGQYLRHLWHALSETHAPVGPAPGKEPGEHLDLVMLHPRGQGSGVRDQSQPATLTPLDKLLWEGWGVTSAAVRGGAQLLHVPYLSAPFVKRVLVVVSAHGV